MIRGSLNLAAKHPGRRHVWRRPPGRHPGGADPLFYICSV